MMHRNHPRPGEKWQHFKGNEYVIIAIAEDKLDGKIVIYGDELPYLPVTAKHTETNEYLLVQEGCPAYTVRKEGLNAKEYLKVWARPFEMFMGVVSSPYGVGASNCWRFEKVEK
jgi:hypothetical protein